MNKVILCGRLTTDPAISETRNEAKMAKFTLAVDRRRKGSEGQSTADFLRILCFNAQAEFVEKYIAQGDKIAIEGRIETGSYNDKDGKKVYTTDIMADKVELMAKRNKPVDEAKVADDANSKSANTSNFVELADDDDELPFN